MEPIKGKDKVLMFRELGSTDKAGLLALQTNHEWTYERDVDTKQTKSGNLTKGAGLSVGLSIEAVASRDKVNTMLKDSVIKGKKLEVWEIDLAGEKQSEKYPALYAIGQLGSWSVPADVEEFEELSTEMTIDGVPVAGFATLTEEQEAEIMYAFKDTTAIG